MLGSMFLRSGVTFLCSRLTPQIFELTPYGSSSLLYAPESFWYTPSRDLFWYLPKNVFENADVRTLPIYIPGLSLYFSK